LPLPRAAIRLLFEDGEIIVECSGERDSGLIRYTCIRKWIFIIPGLAAACLAAGCSPHAPRTFSGAAAYDDAKAFLQFGPRVTGTQANREAGDWILARLKNAGWSAGTDDGEYRSAPVRNIVGRKGQGPVILLGAHYDSRICADQPEGGCPSPVLGADDGASGVAVLLELARTLDLDWSQHQVWLVFFDAEDNGDLNGWDWIVGSRQFAAHVKKVMAAGMEFKAMVLLDMVADADQQFYWEGNSDPSVRAEIWSTAKELGYEREFIPSVRHTMLDDHLPFRDLGIPSVDIIDFDYPYWHTTGDTLDKISAESLERIGRTIEAWLEKGT
jgi:glutaminyl-peptide cyclotransferase